MLVNNGYYETRKVSISNELNRAEEDLSLTERQLFYLFVANINNDVRKDRETGELVGELEVVRADMIYSLAVEDYADVYDISVKWAKQELLELAKRLFRKEIRLEVGDSFVYTRYISYLGYDSETQEVRYMWSQAIIPYISQLRKNFTSYELQSLRFLGHNYAFRLAAMMFEAIGVARKAKIDMIFNLEELKRRFKLEDKYKQTGHLIERVLIDSFDIINKTKSCRLEVKYLDDIYGKRRYIKEGRKVVGVKVEVIATKAPSKEVIEEGKRLRVVKVG